MKTRHARAIRAGILAARQGVRPVMFAHDLMARAYWRTWIRATRRRNPAHAAQAAAETFTHPTTPTAADKAANLDRSSQEGQP